MSPSPFDQPDPIDGADAGDDDDPTIASLLSWALPPGQQNPTIRARLLDRARSTPVATLHRDEGLWFPVAEGVSRKLVFADADDRGSTALWRFGDGAAATLDAPTGDLVLVVIQGGLSLDTPEGATPLTVGDAVGATGVPVALRATSPAAVLIAVTADRLDGPTGLEIVRAEATPPAAMSEQVSARPLFLDRSPRPDVALLTVTPNGQLDGHDHPETEELFCLEGTCRSHGVVLRPGDYQRTRAGAPHDATVSETGSTILVLRRHFA